MTFCATLPPNDTHNPASVDTQLHCVHQLSSLARTRPLHTSSPRTLPGTHPAHTLFYLTHTSQTRFALHSHIFTTLDTALGDRLCGQTHAPDATPLRETVPTPTATQTPVQVQGP